MMIRAPQPLPSGIHRVSMRLFPKMSLETVVTFLYLPRRPTFSSLLELVPAGAAALPARHSKVPRPAALSTCRRKPARTATLPAGF